MKKTILSKYYLKARGLTHLFFLLLLCIFLASPAWSANWYLSQAGAGSKNGTSVENAWSWAQLNWASIQPGDTLYIVGVYNAVEFRVGASGSANNYVTIAGYDSTSGIDLTYNEESTTFSGPDQYGAYVKHITWHPSRSEAGYAEWTTGTTPWNWTELTKATGLPDGTWAAGTAYYDSANANLYWKPLGGSITGKTLSMGSSNAFYINGNNWVKATNLKIYGGRVNVVGQNIWLDHLTVDGLKAGIVVQLFDCDYVRLSYSTIRNGSDGLWNMGGDDDYITIDHNTFTDFKGGNDSHCIGFYDGGNNWVIEYNDLSYANTGITLYGGSGPNTINNNIIRYNHIHHMEGSRANGIAGFERGYGIGFEGPVTSESTRTGNIIAYNIINHCTGTGRPGSMAATGISVKYIGSTNIVANNTVYDCSPNYYISYNPGYPTGGVFKNNISYEPNASSGAGYKKHIMVGVNTAGYSGLSIDNNLYYPDTGTLFYVAPSTYAWNFADWKTNLAAASIAGGDVHSAVANPLFTNASGTHSSPSDFKPGSGSPAVDKGNNTAWSGKPSVFDITGTVGITNSAGTIIAPGGVVDIGAHEVARPGQPAK
jgi:hypothetical protein